MDFSCMRYHPLTMINYVWSPIAASIIIFLAVIVFEGVLRKDTSRKPVRESAHDRGTTGFVGAAFGISWIVLMSSIVLNALGIGTLLPTIVFNIVGLALMLVGFGVRVVAALTLGRFYTRTLETEGNQHVVTSGIYARIRHPGYLGTILLFTAGALAVDNYICLLVVLAVILPAYVNRMKFEEQMLRETFGQEYEEYRKRSSKLIPFIY